MAECKKCGWKVEPAVNLCPKCGEDPSIETITDLPAADVKVARKELKADIKFAEDRREKLLEAECRSCGAPVSGPDALCPSCGTVPGPQAMTDLPRTDFKAAHKKLKEEVREYKEQKKHKD